MVAAASLPSSWPRSLTLGTAAACSDEGFLLLLALLACLVFSLLLSTFTDFYCFKHAFFLCFCVDFASFPFFFCLLVFLIYFLTRSVGLELPVCSGRRLCVCGVIDIIIVFLSDLFEGVAISYLYGALPVHTRFVGFCLILIRQKSC